MKRFKRVRCVVHGDEATPHITVMTIPTIEHCELNARAPVGSREKLAATQTHFAETVGQGLWLMRSRHGLKATYEHVQRVSPTS